MSPVKLIHVMKCLEVLDRDIKELQDLEESLTDNRTYSDALRISVELQINNLLNERVKLMELRIDNASEHLISFSKELEEPKIKLAKNRSKFNLKDFEEDYLDRLSKKKIEDGSQNLQQAEIDLLIKQTKDGSRPRPKDSYINMKGGEKVLPKRKKSTEEILKNLPQLEY